MGRRPQTQDELPPDFEGDEPPPDDDVPELPEPAGCPDEVDGDASEVEPDDEPDEPEVSEPFFSVGFPELSPVLAEEVEPPPARESVR